MFVEDVSGQNFGKIAHLFISDIGSQLNARTWFLISRLKTSSPVEYLQNILLNFKLPKALNLVLGAMWIYLRLFSDANVSNSDWLGQ